MSNRYNKFIAAVVGAIFTGLAAFGVMGPEGAEQLSSTVTSAITALAVLILPNVE